MEFHLLFVSSFFKIGHVYKYLLLSSWRSGLVSLYNLSLLNVRPIVSNRVSYMPTLVCCPMWRLNCPTTVQSTE